MSDTDTPGTPKSPILAELFQLDGDILRLQRRADRLRALTAAAQGEGGTTPSPTTPEAVSGRSAASDGEADYGDLFGFPLTPLVRLWRRLFPKRDAAIDAYRHSFGSNPPPPGYKPAPPPNPPRGSHVPPIRNPVPPKETPRQQAERILGHLKRKYETRTLRAMLDLMEFDIDLERDAAQDRAEDTSEGLKSAEDARREYAGEDTSYGQAWRSGRGTVVGHYPRFVYKKQPDMSRDGDAYRITYRDYIIIAKKEPVIVDGMPRIEHTVHYPFDHPSMGGRNVLGHTWFSTLEDARLAVDLLHAPGKSTVHPFTDDFTMRFQQAQAAQRAALDRYLGVTTAAGGASVAVEGQYPEGVLTKDGDRYYGNFDEFRVEREGVKFYYRGTWVFTTHVDGIDRLIRDNSTITVTGLEGRSEITGGL